MVRVDKSYIKDVPAPPVDPGKVNLTEVIVDVEVLSILEIAEVESLIAIQFELSLTWKDPRLTFHHLKASTSIGQTRQNINIMDKVVQA